MRFRGTGRAWSLALAATLLAVCAGPRSEPPPRAEPAPTVDPDLPADIADASYATSLGLRSDADYVEAVHRPDSVRHDFGISARPEAANLDRRSHPDDLGELAGTGEHPTRSAAVMTSGRRDSSSLHRDVDRHAIAASACSKCLAVRCDRSTSEAEPPSDGQPRTDEPARARDGDRVRRHHRNVVTLEVRRRRSTPSRARDAPLGVRSHVHPFPVHGSGNEGAGWRCALAESVRRGGLHRRPRRCGHLGPGWDRWPGRGAACVDFETEVVVSLGTASVRRRELRRRVGWPRNRLQRQSARSGLGLHSTWAPPCLVRCREAPPGQWFAASERAKITARVGFTER